MEHSNSIRLQLFVFCLYTVLLYFEFTFCTSYCTLLAQDSLFRSLRLRYLCMRHSLPLAARSSVVISHTHHTKYTIHRPFSLSPASARNGAIISRVDRDRVALVVSHSRSLLFSLVLFDRVTKPHNNGFSAPPCCVKYIGSVINILTLKVHYNIPHELPAGISNRRSRTIFKCFFSLFCFVYFSLAFQVSLLT